MAKSEKGDKGGEQTEHITAEDGSDSESNDVDVDEEDNVVRQADGLRILGGVNAEPTCEADSECEASDELRSTIRFR